MRISTIGVFVFMSLPLSLEAAIYELTLAGTVDSVDAPLDSSFAMGDAFELKVQFDPNAGWDMWGSSTTWDGTRFNAYRENGTYQNSFSIGDSYQASNSPVGPLFVDRWDQGAQRVDVGTNNFQGADVSGLVLREIYFDHVLDGTPLPGSNDPDDVLSGSDFLTLNSTTFSVGQDNSVSFASSETSSDYKKVRFSLDTVTVVDVTPVSLPIVYYDQTGITDINSNGFPEFASLRTVRSGNVQVLIKDAVSRDHIKSIGFLSSAYTPISIATIPDTNGNGADEIAVMALHNDTGKTRTTIKDSLTGATINNFNFNP